MKLAAKLSRKREAFCAKVGLDPGRPFVLYVCSALFWGSPVEAEFVRRWIRSLRESSDPDVRSAAVLVRPHPARMDEWKDVDLSSFGEDARGRVYAASLDGAVYRLAPRG